MEEFENYSAKLEELGEPEIRERFAHGSYAERNKAYVSEWLRRKDVERAEARAALRDQREERTLSISEEANEIASRALEISERQTSEAARAAAASERQARYAMYAAIAAIIAALIALREDIDVFISWALNSIVG